MILCYHLFTFHLCNFIRPLKLINMEFLTLPFLDFKSCREEIAGALQEFCNRWCKREHVESNALNSWKLNIFKIIDGRISFYCNNLDLLPPKPKFTFRHLKKGIQELHRRFVLAPADKAANNVVVV